MTKRKTRNKPRDAISEIHSDLSRFVGERRTHYEKMARQRKAVAKQAKGSKSLRDPRATLQLLLAEIDLRSAESLERDVLRIIDVAAQRVDAIEREARASIAAEFGTHRATRAMQVPPPSKPPKGVKPEVHKLATQAQYATIAVIAEVERLRVELAVAAKDPDRAAEAAVMRNELKTQIGIADRLRRCLRSIAANRK